MAMRGVLQLSRRLSTRVEPPVLSKSRTARRFNMMDADRIKFYNWSLACIVATAVLPLWMCTTKYKTCECSSPAKGDAAPRAPVSLQGKVVVIMGASSGIGEGIAAALAREPCKLVLCARRKDRLDSNLKKFKDSGCKLQEAATFALDVTNRAAVIELFDILAKDARFSGGVDVVINCAGVMYFTLTKNQMFDDWEQTIDVNCKGTVNSCGAALPFMLEKKSGHIVNISSDAARQTFPALSVYNASKSFVHEFTKGLRCELVGTGVRVTELLPGDVRTDLIVRNTDAEAAQKVGVEIGKKIGGEDFDSDAETRNSYLDPADIAAAVKYALTAPGHVGVNEILIEPRDQMYGDPTSVGS